jgi:hypothetical protein
MSDRFRRKHEPRHIRLYHSVTGCEAWRELTGNGIKVLIALARYDDGNSNGQLFFSERQGAKDTGLSRNTVRRALAELIAKGFIAQTKPGAFNRNNLLAATYRLTWVAWPGGKPSAPTRDFERWKPDGNSQAQSLTETGAVIAPPLETQGDLGADFDPSIMETPHVSVGPSMSETGPQLLYQGDSRSDQETGQWKQANPASGAFPAILRDATLKRLADAQPGEQKRLSERIDCPPGTLSKFINGRNLPETYHQRLAAIVLPETVA